MKICVNIIFIVLMLPLYAGVDYNSEIQPIFNSRCTNCHSGSDAEEDLSLTSYNNVMNGGDSGDVVIPYDHANSLLWQYINSGFMPPGTNDLTDSQIDLIAEWINEGALPEPNEPMVGDLNDDGVVNVLDVVLLVNSVLNGGSADDYPQADVNGDGTLNVLDVVTLVNWVLYGDDGACIDYDGNVYETIQIGNQLWMAENLKVTHYRDGSEIPNITNNGDWSGLSTGAYGDYNNNPTNSETYGRLYNWYTVDDDRGVCPDGWHVPSDGEYTVLTDYLGGEDIAGGKMKETGLGHWNSPNTGATNESGFTGLPAGYRYFSNGTYSNMGTAGYFWSSSEYNSFTAWYRDLHYYYSNVLRSLYYKHDGCSIRCLGD